MVHAVKGRQHSERILCDMIMSTIIMIFMTLVQDNNKYSKINAGNDMNYIGKVKYNN
jgi:hypothetical protein